MPARRPADAVIPALVGGAYTVFVLWALAAAGRPGAEKVALGLPASFAIVAALTAVFYFRLKWSGFRSFLTAVSGFLLSLSLLLLILDLRTWPAAVVLVPGSVLILRLAMRD